MKAVKWGMVMAWVLGMLVAGEVKAGSLSPTNAPGPTMHTLEEIYQKLLGSDQKLLSLQQRQAALESQLSPAGMVLIPAGVNTGTDPDSGVYSLTNETAFYMDKYEVTKAQWDAVRTWGLANGYTDLATGAGKAANHPVQIVNWYNCVTWCNARSEKEGREAAYYTDAGYTSVYKTGTVSGVSAPYLKGAARGYRLPTDAQWEYAARGGATSHRFPWSDSDEIQHARANYNSSVSYAFDTSPTRGYHTSYTNALLPYTSPAGAFAPNGYGLYDMTGNVWEWCFDWYPGFEGSYRVLRGGSWSYRAYYCRVGYRFVSYPGIADYDVGFRAALPPGQ